MDFDTTVLVEPSWRPFYFFILLIPWTVELVIPGGRSLAQRSTDSYLGVAWNRTMLAVYILTECAITRALTNPLILINSYTACEDRPLRFHSRIL